MDKNTTVYFGPEELKILEQIEEIQPIMKSLKFSSKVKAVFKVGAQVLLKKEQDLYINLPNFNDFLVSLES